MELTVFYVHFITILPFLSCKHTDHCLVKLFFCFVQHCDEILSLCITTNNSAHGKHTSRHKTPTHTGHLGTRPRNKFKFFACVIVAFDFRHVVNITIIISFAISCSLLWTTTTATLSTIWNDQTHMGSTSLLISQIIRLFFIVIIIFFCIIWNRARITTERNKIAFIELYKVWKKKDKKSL